MIKCGLLGKNIKYSLSPKLHEIILEKINISGEYILLDSSEAEDENLFIKNVVERLKNGDLSGINITIPYKEAIIKYIDRIDEVSKKIGAINTIKVEKTSLVGYNTDYYGIIETLTKMKLCLNNKKCYIFGTGGSSKAVYYAIKELGGIPCYVSRGKVGKDIISYEEVKKIDNYGELAINCTPSNLNIEILSKFKNVFELKYIKKAEKEPLENINIVDGLYMLVVQGIKAQELWQNRDIGLYEEIFYQLNEEIKK